ncbi:hypothetical protein PUNSTDRAFT_117368 [Punctularia strigosozonata HHB-11173 SS5]|uniref:uncharacterized protein n=1 Tax=Punctularia strigosozonata (strain HHB-11173) TaxID=741275 RepID=UPI00044182DC|nr:uncharacterized protein PUNSTDRAFT_117368 [Punctularia strigosozonata HHB-11173 SS5]EIN13652.1 hypothetical protein PUNSTDRAFT_117368 [Punctularia strigosozonata HHB-11173 SS5]
MAKALYLTFATLTDILNPRSLYLVLYGWLLGMSLWVTFFGGFIALKALPRHQFGALQHRTFPVYFSVSIALSTILLLMWTTTHPDVLSYIAKPTHVDVAQAYALAFVLVNQTINQLVVGPLTSRTMFQRHKLEKDEGKNYNDPAASDAMKALNRKFGMLHGVSSLCNLGANLALIFHGLWLGHVNTALKGY